ncbi:MAG: hypothetical protein RBU37_10540 [Myxococcota bacterium]|jgi:hypothetical protein|nr:hypothetical protein [Myxococcota bacterium]
MRWLLGVLSLLLLAPIPQVSLAHPSSLGPDLDTWRLVLGPSAAYLTEEDEDDAFCLSTDWTVAHFLFWLSLGSRHAFRSSGGSSHGAYLEAGAWFLANWGLGYGFNVDEEEEWSHGPHFFFGLPFPVTGDPVEERGVVLEPYLRTGYHWGAQPYWLFETGVLLKFSLSLEFDGEDEPSSTPSPRPRF